MPKNEKNSPKAIANKIKSKGLQKLRWYCQMCQKQCRDQNGFKCHLMSESHQRQLLIFAENPHHFLDDFSKDFEKGYTDILRRQFGTKRVRANVVYQEYIKEKEHIHMNATKWMSLSGFVQHLGRSGVAKIDKNEKGWWLTWIDREEEERQERGAKKQKMDRDDEERMRELIEKQAQRALEQHPDSARQTEYTEMKRDDDEKIEFKMAAPIDKKETGNDAEPGTSKKTPPAKVFLELGKRKSSSKEDEYRSFKSEKPVVDRKDWNQGSKAKSSMQLLREEEESKKERRNRKDHWLFQGIVVKIVTKRLGDVYHKKKGFIIELFDEYTAGVKLLHAKGDVLKLDQTHLETVIPAVGRSLLVVNGAYRGNRAVLDHIDTDKFAVNVTLSEGTCSGRKLKAIPYEDVCKLHVPKEEGE